MWLFTFPLPGVDIRRFGHRLGIEHGVEAVELFPKQDRLSTGPGSLVRLPLGIHHKTGKVYPFIGPDGTPLAPTLQEQLGLLANPQRVREPFISSVLSRASTSPTEMASPTLGLPLPGDAHGETLSERIKSTITVYDFVSQYVELDRRGRGHCPFHDDQHKSFSINRQSNYWHCFAGCGGGSLIDFWARWREKEGQDPDFIPTITDLAEMLL
jgi:hypothetical protein